jgi:hypothetical protein
MLGSNLILATGYSDCGFHAFLQSFQARIVLQLGYDYFLPNLSQFVINHPVLYSLNTECVTKLPIKTFMMAKLK